VHFVIPETDAGPIVMQGAVPVAADDTADTLAARVLSVEHQIYPQALRLLATDGIKIIGDVTTSTAGVDAEDSLIAPTVI
jgi:phosphoribosylglycinamide formyltransferase-1